jgi:hypothetical protein
MVIMLSSCAGIACYDLYALESHVTTFMRWNNMLRPSCAGIACYDLHALESHVTTFKRWNRMLRVAYLLTHCYIDRVESPMVDININENSNHKR